MNIVTMTADAYTAKLRSRTLEETDLTIEEDVRNIVARVRHDGDQALIHYTALFDKCTLRPEDIRIDREQLRAAYNELDAADREALESMAERIKRFHERQKDQLKGYDSVDEWGNRLGQCVRPMRRAGLYVPGGRAAYPSSVLMGLIPASLAGVSERYVVTPPGREGVPLPVLAAAHIGGATALFQVGGAQAIAALAYGTDTVPAVDIIVGPGNVYVTEAKRQVYGQTAIDGLAGPTEIMIIADDGANPRWVATDLLAQAEHDPQACAVLLCFSRRFADQVIDWLKHLVQEAPRKAIMVEAMENNGAIVLCGDVNEAIRIANLAGPEHLSIQVEQAAELLERVETAGAVFLGPYAPVAAGDYAAGTNHILPTSGTGRFASGVSVETFLRRFSYFEGTPQGTGAWMRAATHVARLEGFYGHAASLEVREEEDYSETI